MTKRVPEGESKRVRDRERERERSPRESATKYALVLCSHFHLLRCLILTFHLSLCCQASFFLKKEKGE